MKHKTWFRLVIKAIGVLLVGLSVENAVYWLARFLDEMGQPIGTLYPNRFWNVVPGLLGAALQLGFGLYLFLGGRWIVDKAIPSNRPYCPECGYDLSAAGGSACPECGAALSGATRGP